MTIMLAEIDANEIVLKNVVIEHVFRRLGEIHDPFREGRRLHAEGHVLGVHAAGRVVVAADAADPAGDEMRVARILAPHEDAVAAKDRRGGVAFDDAAIFKIDLRVNAEAADNPGDRDPTTSPPICSATLSPVGAHNRWAGLRQTGSLFIEARVKARRARIARP